MNIQDYNLSEDQKSEIHDRIYNFLSKLNCDICITDYVDIDNIKINDNNVYDNIYQEIEDGNGFNVDIIYYSNAIEYLSNNDASLNESLSIAAEYGYTPENLNSEILASLLASQNAREQFNELETEINDFFEELVNDIEELIEE